MKRTGEVTFLGNPLTAIGAKLEPGAKAPEFELLANDLKPVKLSDSAGKVRLLSVVPSLDTPVCDLQTRQFNERIAQFGDDVVGYTVSADLPFAQARWCGSIGDCKIQTLSDHLQMAFGAAYGTHIEELRLEQRSIFIVDRDGVIRYVEYVNEITEHPDYDKAIAKIQELVK